jgi:uncharacterized phosphatase
MKKLYFIRHGQSVMNTQKLWAGVTDTPLTEEGRQQAKRAGKEAKKLNIDLIVSSPLSRAHETARIIAKEIDYPNKKIIISPLLVERDGGKYEGQPYVPSMNLDHIEGFEKDDVIVARAHEALKWINTHTADHILVVSHGSFGRAMRSILKAEYPLSHPEKIANAEILCWVEEQPD